MAAALTKPEREMQLSGAICRAYEIYYNCKNKQEKNRLRIELECLVQIWNLQEGRRCESCGVILQMMTTGTLINCPYSRQMLKLEPTNCP
jgi:hypothetical protein